MRHFTRQLSRLKVKSLETCYSAAYMSHTQEQQHFTITKVATNWQELIIPQHIILPSIAGTNGQWDLQCSWQTYHFQNQPH